MGCSREPRSVNIFNNVIITLNCTIQNLRKFRKFDESLSQICSQTRKQIEFSIMAGDLGAKPQTQGTI